MKKIIVLALMLVTHTASAKVYMCVDHVTGKTSFTDKACETVHSSSEEVRVDPSNLKSGRKYSTEKRSRVEKVWNSQRDERRTGRDLNAQRSQPYENALTAQAD